MQGGLEFFTTQIESADGDLALLQCAMDAANKEIDPVSSFVLCLPAACGFDGLSSTSACEFVRVLRISPKEMSFTLAHV